MAFGIEQGIDFIALSFIREAKEVEEVREFVKKKKSSVQLISKIETRQAVKNIEEIVRALKKAGIRTFVGLQEKDAKELNRSYLTWRLKKRPYVVLKLAMTLDGKIATAEGESKWITGPEAREWVHRLRSQVDGILIGRKTMEKDNPTLSSHGQGKNPIPIVIDAHLKSKSSAKLFKKGGVPPIIVGSTGASKSKEKQLTDRGAVVFREPISNGQIKLSSMLKNLLKNNVYQLLVEGGSETSWAFLKEKVVDELYLFVANKLLGGADAITAIGGEGFKLKNAAKLKNSSITKVGSDILIHGYL
jgi:diaminohydroxyphosphoribosylaminopyrimidine deaminase/5-amino-6-(5-phosphoribosylamino)uracil reductase